MIQCHLNIQLFTTRNDSYTNFSQQSHNKLTWLVIFYYFFCFVFFSFCKKNNKILPATSVCCRAVVRNECRDHFSKKKKKILPATSACCGTVVRNKCKDHFSMFIAQLLYKCSIAQLLHNFSIQKKKILTTFT
jgi:F0F1-type ATP synthase membrane subunit a